MTTLRTDKQLSIVGVVLAVTFTVSVGLIARPLNFSSNEILWSQSTIEVTLPAGGTLSKHVTLTAATTLSTIDIEPVPELAAHMTIQPGRIESLAANKKRDVKLSFAVPPNCKPGQYNGTVHVKRGSKTLPQTLKVIIHVLSSEGFSLLDIASDSDLVVLGDVVSLRSEYDQSGKRILTFVTIVISRFIKGSAPTPTMVVVVPGGRVEPIQQVVSGAPSFRSGEKVVLFVTGPDSQASYAIPEGAFGKFTVKDDPISGQVVIIDPHYKDIDLLEPMHPDLRTFISRSQGNNVTLTELFTAIGVTP